MNPMKLFSISPIYYTYICRIPKNIPFAFAFSFMEKALALGILLIMVMKIRFLYEAISDRKKSLLSVVRLQIIKKNNVLRCTVVNKDLVSMFSLWGLKPRVNSGGEGPNQYGELTLIFLKPAPKWHRLVMPGSYFLLIIGLFVLGSVQAQTNLKNVQKDSISPLMVGASVPDDFWTKKHLFYVNGDTVVRTLEEYKGKLLLLDFWATWCTICWSQMPKNEELITPYNGDVKVLLIDTKSTKDNFQKIELTYDKYLKPMGIESLESIYDDEYFEKLFPVEGYPKYMWISPTGHFFAATGRISVSKGHIDGILENLKPKK